MRRRHLMYNAQLDYISLQQQLGNTLVVCPDEALPIGRLEMKPDKMRHIYNLGRELGLKNLERIKVFLDK